MFFMGYCCTQAISQTETSIDWGFITTVDWKGSSELNLTIANEQSKMDQNLSIPTLAQDEKALFLGYKRMLNHIQTHIQSGKPMEEAIVLAYEQVLAEGPKDPELALMPEGLLGTMVPGLIESLTQTPVAGN